MDLNSKIEGENARRKEDAVRTKQELAKMEERMTTQFANVSKWLEDHGTGITLLHEGQMHLEMNLKMSMTKMGVTPSNSLPSDALTSHHIADVSAAMQNATTDSDVVQDSDGDFKMTEEVFDSVLADCSRSRDTQRLDNNKKVPVPQDSTEVGDEDLRFYH